jgi:hypothetical protein
MMMSFGMKIYCLFLCAIFALAAILAISCEIFSHSKLYERSSNKNVEKESSNRKMSSKPEIELELWTKNNWRY